VNHHHHATVSRKTQVSSSILSVLFAFIASSHHWLHMSILFLLGGSTSALATMSGILWVRRLMIVITLLTTAFSIRKFYTQRNMPNYIKLLTLVSAVISIGFVIYTLFNFGW
jgi:hypothetical protein